MFLTFISGVSWGVGCSLSLQSLGLLNSFDAIIEATSSCKKENATFLEVTPSEMKYYQSIDDLFDAYY